MKIYDGIFKAQLTSDWTLRHSANTGKPYMMAHAIVTGDTDSTNDIECVSTKLMLFVQSHFVELQQFGKNDSLKLKGNFDQGVYHDRLTSTLFITDHIESAMH